MIGDAAHLLDQAMHLSLYYGYKEVSPSHLVFAGLGSLNPDIKKAYGISGIDFSRFHNHQVTRKEEISEASRDRKPPRFATDVKTIVREFEELTANPVSAFSQYNDIDLLIYALSKAGVDWRELDFVGISRAALLSNLMSCLTEDKRKDIEHVTDKAQINIEKFCKDLSNQAAQGELDPLIGRKKELKRLVQILGRRRKNNPVILGEAGTGKTALIEGLAQAVHNKESWAKPLFGKRIVELDMHLMLAGTKYRGEFEERLKLVANELEKDRNTVVFMDEVHNMVGAGACEGAPGDAANILKPSLARGRIQLIGATTKKEYNIIKGDPALERRFQPLELHELTNKEITDIVKGVIPTYEEFHKVTFTEDSIEAIVRLGSELPKRQAPDAQIDIIDEAGSRYKGNTITGEMVEKIFKIQLHSNQSKEKKLGFGG